VTIVSPVSVTVKTTDTAILRFLLFEFEASLLVMARFATVQAKIAPIQCPLFLDVSLKNGMWRKIWILDIEGISMMLKS
jgi:hypothetical protein